MEVVKIADIFVGRACAWMCRARAPRARRFEKRDAAGRVSVASDLAPSSSRPRRRMVLARSSARERYVKIARRDRPHEGPSLIAREWRCARARVGKQCGRDLDRGIAIG